MPSSASDTPFERICAKVARAPELSLEDERRLARAWRERGDRRAADELVTAHLPLVIRQASRLRGYGVPKDELIAEGNLGLLKAVEKFDLRGVRFKTYATYWIRAYMLAHAMRAGTLVTSATGALGAKFFFKLRSARARLEAQYGPQADGIDGMLARQFGVTEEQVRQYSARLGQSDVSLDEPVGEDADTTRGDLLACGRVSPVDEVVGLERDELVQATVQRVLKGLDSRERAVLEERLLADEGDATLSDLGQKFSLSRERLRQIELRLKKRLGRALEVAGAHEFLH